MPEIPRWFPRRTWIRRAIPAGVVAVLVVGGTALVRTNANASPIDTYRTTTVTTGFVEQRLDLTGSVQRVNQVSRGFAVTGTVSSVSVAVGDTVKAGQALATLDPGPLASAVTTAEAALAQAKANLESDQTPTTTASSTTSTLASASRDTTTTGASRDTNAAQAPSATPTTSPLATSSGRSAAGTNKSLVRAQKNLTTAQSAIAADLGRASSALAQCASFFPSKPSPAEPSRSTTTTVTPSPTVSSTPSPTTAPATTSPPSTAGPSSTTTASPTTTTTTTPPAATAPSDAAIKACIGALQTAPTQRQIQQDQKALTRSQTELTTAVTLAITTAGGTAKQPDDTAKTSGTANASAGASRPATNQPATNQPATNQASGGSTSGTGRTGESSAARVTSDQGAVTNAEAALSSAKADQASATLKASIGGTVGSVSLAKGASSEGKNIVIVGVGAVEVTVNLPLASMAKVKVGQKANVTPQGATSSVPGAVTSISLLPTATQTGTGTAQATATATASSPVYPVVVLVPAALPALASGSRAEVSLLIGTAGNVLTVPNSALTPLGNGQALALTVKGGVATPALVKTGYAGTLATQITSGLAAGQQVVLADLSTALPTNTTNARRFGVGGGAAGGFGGAGLGGGTGFSGAGLGGAGLGGGTNTGRSGFTPRG